MSELHPDRACMDRLRAGDLKALDELYDRHTPLLYGIVLRILGRAADAEEVLQDTWVQAWKRAASWDSSRGTVAAWLITLARSRAIDRLRSLSARQRAEIAAPMANVPRAQDEPATAAADRQRNQRMTAAMASLSPQQRQVLELGYFGGLSQSEIAARLGAPLGTVKSWARQGLMRLRELVPQEELT